MVIGRLGLSSHNDQHMTRAVETQGNDVITHVHFASDVFVNLVKLLNFGINH